MNIATLGVRIDPTQAQTGAAAVNAATTGMANTAVAAQARTEAAARGTATATVAAARGSAAASEEATRRAAANMAGHVNHMKGLVGLYQTLAKAAAVLGGGMIASAAIKEGLRFNAVLQDAGTGVAAILRATNPQKYGDFQTAMRASAAAVEMLKKSAEESPASFESLLGGFQATAAGAAKANLTMKEHISLVLAISQALATLKIPEQQMLTEMRGLFTGQIDAKSDVAKALSITKEDVEGAIQSGKLFDLLSGKLSAFSEAAETVSGNVSIMMSNIGDKTQQLLAAITLPAFKAIGEQMNAFLGEIGEAGKGGAIDQMSEAIADLATMMLELLRAFVMNLNTIIEVAKALALYWLAMKAVNLGGWIAGLRMSTTAIQGETASMTANTMARLRMRNAAAPGGGRAMGGMGVGAMMMGGMALGGGMGTAVGIGMGSLLGPLGALVGGGLGLALDKWRESATTVADEMERVNKEITQATKLLTDQVGNATTINDRMIARRELLKEIERIESAIAQAKNDDDTPRLDWLQNKRDDMLNMLNRPALFGSIKQDDEDGKKVAEWAERQLQAMRQTVDLADDEEKKREATLEIERAILAAQEDQERASKAGALGQNAQLDAIKEYLATLNDINNTIDEKAGLHEIEKREQEALNALLKEMHDTIGDQLEMAEAKLRYDTETVNRLEDQRRTEELLKKLGTDAASAKKEQLEYVEKIVDAERRLKEVEAGNSVNDAFRSQRLQGLEGQDRLDELERQRAQIQAEEAARLRAGGVTGVPDDLRARDIAGLNSPGAGIQSQQQALELLVPALQKIAGIEGEIIDATRDVQMQTEKVREQIVTDADIMRDFRDKVDQLKERFQGGTGSMSPREMEMRRNDLEERTVQQLGDPGQWSEQLGKWRVMQEEMARSAEQTQKRITNGSATMTESMAHGVTQAAKAWGNFDQQIANTSAQIMNVMADGIGTALVDIMDGTKSASEAFADMGKAIVREIGNIIMKMIIQLALQTALNAAQGKSTNVNWGQLLQSAMGTFGGAGGGAPQAKASGGPVYGGRGAIDDVPAMLTAGEYVINRDAARAIGLETLDAMNSANRYARGGSVGTGMQTGGRRGGGEGGGNNIAVNVNYHAPEESDPEKEKRRSKRLGENIEAAVMAVIARENRQGGLNS